MHTCIYILIISAGSTAVPEMTTFGIHEGEHGKKFWNLPKSTQAIINKVLYAYVIFRFKKQLWRNRYFWRWLINYNYKIIIYNGGFRKPLSRVVKWILISLYSMWKAHVYVYYGETHWLLQKSKHIRADASVVSST